LLAELVNRSGAFLIFDDVDLGFGGALDAALDALHAIATWKMPSASSHRSQRGDCPKW